MGLLDLAKSWLISFKARPIHDSERDGDAEDPDLRDNEHAKAGADSLNSALFHQNVAPLAREESEGSTTKDILVPDFQPETSAQDYFSNNRGEQARGAFHEVADIRWDHDEADWSIEELKLPASPAARHHSKPRAAGNPAAGMRQLPLEAAPPTREEICCSADRVRSFASSRGWLSPKAIGALKKIQTNEEYLNISESNSLTYLMGRMREIPEVADDLKILRIIMRA